MLVDTSDLVSVTDLGRGLSRFVNEAATSGRRFVILNSNIPTAALVSIADLERLNALETETGPEPDSLLSGVELDRPAQADLEARAGYSAVGRNADGEPVYWSLAGHVFAAGRPGAGLGQCFSAAIAGAVPDPDVPTEFVVAASGPYASLWHQRLHSEIPVAVELLLEKPVHRRRFVEKLQAEIERRQSLFRDLRVETITELRQSGPAVLATQVPNMVVVMADSDGLALGGEHPIESDVTLVLSEVLAHGAELGIHLWFGTSHLGTDAGSALAPLKRTVRQKARFRALIGNTETADQSRDILGSAVGVGGSVPAGTGWYRAGRSTDVQTFAVTAPTGEPSDVIATGQSQCWRPWLTQPLALGDIPAIDPDTDTEPGLTLPVGVSNPPWEALTVSLNDETPHLCFVGGASSGLDEALLTLVGSALLRYAPARCAFVAVECERGPLSGVANLGNVAGYADAFGGGADVAARMFGEAVRIVDLRRSAFEAGEVSSLAQYLAGKSGEAVRLDPYGRLIVLISGLQFCLEGNEDTVRYLLERGGQYGVHVVATAANSDHLPHKIRALLSFPLRLSGTNTRELAIGPLQALAAKMPTDQPGRCIDLRSARHGRIAVPYPGKYSSAPERASAYVTALEALDPQGNPVTPVPVVPTRVDGEYFWRDVATRDRTEPAVEDGLRAAAGVPIPLGLSVATGDVVDIPAQRSPHFVVVGASGSGRSATMQAVVESIRRQFSADGRDGRPEAKVVCVDERSELAGVREQLARDGYLLTSDRSPKAVLDAVAAIVSERTPSPEAMPSAEALRARSWYEGPEVFVLIDTPELRDQDWVADAVAIAQARRDLGVHIYLSDTAAQYPIRRLSNGLHRALADAPCLLLSGPSHEGVLWSGSGIRFAQRPPGRGLLVDPHSLKSQTVQVPWYPAAAGLAGY